MTYARQILALPLMGLAYCILAASIAIDLVGLGVSFLAAVVAWGAE